jgi:quercetin dioxygenase-like cupin family protein
MLQRCLIIALVTAGSYALVSPTNARDAVPPASYPAVPLLSTGTTVVGETIHYPNGQAHVTAAIITLAPGGHTILHKHGVPLFAYILKGELTVNYGTHGTRSYRQGQAFMEAMDVAHFGINKGTELVRILAVYMGAKNAKDVTRSNSGARRALTRHRPQRRSRV